jgi:hypothetical protein
MNRYSGFSILILIVVILVNILNGANMKFKAGILGLVTVVALATPGLAQEARSTSVNSSTQPEVTYKRRLPITLTNNDVVDTLYANDGNYSSWAVVKINSKREFKIYHTTHLTRGMLVSRWFDHPVTAMKICMTDGFDASDCKVVDGDTAMIPEGKTISNLSISFKYTESGKEYRETLNIPKDAKPE